MSENVSIYYGGNSKILEAILLIAEGLGYKAASSKKYGGECYVKLYYATGCYNILGNSMGSKLISIENLLRNPSDYKPKTPPKKMTVSEIAKALGHGVEVVEG